MEATFERYWRSYAQWVVSWTNALLAPPEPHVLRLLSSAAEIPALAETIANGFDDPRVFYPWWFDAKEADRLIATKRAQDEARLDPRDLPRALGQFATGVTVVTTRAEDGGGVGVTANSFTSLSLDPPLVMWALDRNARSWATFQLCTSFAVNVLAAGQHHLRGSSPRPQTTSLQVWSSRTGPAACRSSRACSRTSSAGPCGSSRPVTTWS